MKAGVVYGIRDLRYEEIDKPKLIDGSALVKFMHVRLWVR